jgi:Mce-associated membrane protein
VASSAPRRRVAGTRRRVRPGTSSTLVLEAGRPEQDDTLTGPDTRTESSTSTAAPVPARPADAERQPPADSDASDVAASSDEGLEVSRRGSGRLWASAVGATLALALLAASLVYGLRPTVSDGDRTAAVGSARTTLESLLSYSGSSFDKHVGEVTPQLTAPFKDQFTKVAATDIKPMAVKNEATVQAKVYEAGVMDASGDGGEGTTVRVMAFVNQATTTKAQQAPAIDQNRVIATMRKVGDRWLVSELAAY